MSVTIKYLYGSGDDARTGEIVASPSDWMVSSKGLSLPSADGGDFWHLAAGTSFDLDVPQSVYICVVRVLDATGIPNRTVQVFLCASIQEMLDRLTKMYRSTPTAVKVTPDTGVYKITQSTVAYVGKMDWSKRNCFLNVFETPFMIVTEKLSGYDF